jgi:hypothetical protein
MAGNIAQMWHSVMHRIRNGSENIKVGFRRSFDKRIKIGIENKGRDCGLGCTDTAGHLEHGNEPVGVIKAWNILIG